MRTIALKRDGYSLNKGVRIGVDLAISQKETADYTAIVLGRIIGEGRTAVLYILPNIYNKKMTFPETVDTCKKLYGAFSDSRKPTFIIEDVAYQKALPQQLQNEGIYDIRTSRPLSDKRSRIALTSHLIQTGRVLFPKQGANLLIDQLVNFGVEKHDDLADAFSMLVLDCIEHPPITPKILWI